MLKLLFAHHEKIDRHQQPLQGPIEPDHLFVAIVHGWLDDQEIDVTVVIGIPAGMGTEQNDPARLCRRHQPLHGRAETIGCRSPWGWCVYHTGILPVGTSEEKGVSHQIWVILIANGKKVSATKSG